MPRSNPSSSVEPELPSEEPTARELHEIRLLTKVAQRIQQGQRVWLVQTARGWVVL